MEPFVFTHKSIETGSFLVHVYRNAGDTQAPLAGTVERLGNGERQAFHSASELLQLLGITGNESGGQGDERA